MKTTKANLPEHILEDIFQVMLNASEVLTRAEPDLAEPFKLQKTASNDYIALMDLISQCEQLLHNIDRANPNLVYNYTRFYRR